MKCWVHFGMHKTGSTSIQSSLHAPGLDPRFYYLDMGGKNASLALANGFLKRPERFHKHKKKGTSSTHLAVARKASRQRLHDQLDTAGTRSAILSAEEICTLARNELADLHSHIAIKADEIKAIGYVRALASFMESVFQQRLKGGRDRFEIARTYPGFRSRIEKFDQVFGQSNVVLGKFDPATFPSGDVVRDFCGRLGIDLPASAAQRVNDAISLDAVRLLYCYRRLGPGFGGGPAGVRENRLLVARLQQLQGPKLRLAASLLEPILRSNRADIDWIEARMNTSFHEALPDDGPQTVASEDDLLKASPDALAWLADQLPSDDRDLLRGQPGARDIAAAMHALRVNVAQGFQKERGATISVTHQRSLQSKELRTGRAERQSTPDAASPRSMGCLDAAALLELANAATQWQTVPTAQALEWVQQEFAQRAAQLSALKNGSLEISGLGRFEARKAADDALKLRFTPG